MPLSVADLHPALHDLFFDTADDLARDAGFVRRRRALTGSVFARAVVFTLLRTPAATLEGYADFAADHLGVGVTPNAFDQRFTPAAAAFLGGLLAAAMDRAPAPARPNLLPVLRRFAGVYLRDATTVHLPGRLAGDFPARAGKNRAPAAAVKVVLEQEVTTGAFTALAVVAAAVNDKAADVSDGPLPAGALLLEDMGFFAGGRLKHYAGQGVYVLTRAPASTAFFDEAGARIDLAAWLGRAGGSYLDRPVRILHDAKLAVRLLAVRLPDDVARARRDRVVRDAAKRRRPVRPAKLALCAWHVLVTTAPAEVLSAYEAWAIRSVRWQVELVFKGFKSDGGLERTNARTAARVLAEVYGKLLAQVVQQWVLLAAGYVPLRHNARRLTRRVRALAGAIVAALGSAAGLGRQVRQVARWLGRCRVAAKPGDPSTFERLAVHDYEFRVLEQRGET